MDKLSKRDFYKRVQELAQDFSDRYSDSSPMFPWYFVIRPDTRCFDSHVHLCSFQAYEDSSNGYQKIKGPLNDKEEITWYAGIDEDDGSIKTMYAKYVQELAFV